MLQEAFDRVVETTVDACRAVYGERLHGVVVFGSVGRRTMHPDSDVDLLVVAEPLPRRRLARMDEFAGVDERTSAVLEDAWKSGVHARLSPLILTLEELANSGFLLFDIAYDGDVRFDPGGEVAELLARVRRRLEERGARRYTPSGARYWVLDPDLRPGDVVVL